MALGRGKATSSTPSTHWASRLITGSATMLRASISIRTSRATARQNNQMPRVLAWRRLWRDMPSGLSTNFSRDVSDPCPISPWEVVNTDPYLVCNSYNYPEFQGTMNTACLQNQNASNPLFHDLAVNNTGNRQWNWMLCNEPFEWWQAAAPHSHPTFVSRLVNAAYWRDQCASWFPPEHDGHSIYTYSLALGKRSSDIDKWTGGWFGTNTTRAMFANGEFDPWRGATLSASDRPGGPVNSTEKLPVRVLKGGTHCSDMYAPNWEANEGAKRAADEQVEEMKGWVAEFYREKGKIPPSY